jgi:hypothetical protein
MCLLRYVRNQEVLESYVMPTLDNWSLREKKIGTASLARSTPFGKELNKSLIFLKVDRRDAWRHSYNSSLC